MSEQKLNDLLMQIADSAAEPYGFMIVFKDFKTKLASPIIGFGFLSCAGGHLARLHGIARASDQPFDFHFTSTSGEEPNLLNFVEMFLKRVAADMSIPFETLIETLRKSIVSLGQIWCFNGYIDKELVSSEINAMIWRLFWGRMIESVVRIPGVGADSTSLKEKLRFTLQQAQLAPEH